MELKRLYDLKLELRCKKMVLEELKESLDGLKAINFQEKLQGGSVSSDDNLINKLHRIEELEKEIAHLYDLQFEIENIIANIKNNKEKVVLYYRYITDMTWENIAEETNYSISQVRRIHSTAIKKIKRAKMLINGLK